MAGISVKNEIAIINYIFSPFFKFSEKIKAVFKGVETLDLRYHNDFSYNKIVFNI
jgi:hypothetical protein